MKVITRHYNLQQGLLIVVLIATTSFSAMKSDVKEFKIEFESFKGGLKAYGLKGTAFKEIFFALGNDVQMRVDEFGTPIAHVKSNRPEDNFADFEFTIEKVDDEYKLVSKKGTTWIELSFTFSENNRAIVDQNGVTLDN